MCGAQLVACAQMPPVVTLWSTCMAIPIRTPLQTTGGSASSSSKSAEFNIAAVFSCVYFIIYYLIRFSGNWSATVKHYGRPTSYRMSLCHQD